MKLEGLLSHQHWEVAWFPGELSTPSKLSSPVSLGCPCHRQGPLPLTLVAAMSVFSAAFFSPGHLLFKVVEVVLQFILFSDGIIGFLCEQFFIGSP